MYLLIILMTKLKIRRRGFYNDQVLFTLETDRNWVIKLGVDASSEMVHKNFHINYSCRTMQYQK